MFSVSQSSSYTIVQNIKHKMSRYYEIHIQHLLFVNLHWIALLAWKMQIQIVSYVNVNVVCSRNSRYRLYRVCSSAGSVQSVQPVQWREWTVLSVETETRARQHRDL